MDTMIKEGTLLPKTTLADMGLASGIRVLYFMRSATCSICRGHVLLLANRYDKLKALGASVTAFIPESEQDASDLATQLKVPFSIRSSEGAYKLANLSSVLFGTLQQSGTLVVGADARVALLRQASNPFNSLNERELFATVQKLAETARPAAAM